MQPYGTWPSPFDAADIAASAPRIDGARFVGDEIWWGESVPAEGGRVTVRSSTGAVVLPEPWNARSRVHEYGGGAWTADAHGTLFFVDAGDQRVYRMLPGELPQPLTPAGPNHGGLRLQHGRLFAVREDLTVAPHRRAIVEIPTDGGDPREIVATSGFVAHPALSPDGTRIAWVQWSDRHMPWQQAQLHIAGFGSDAMTSMPARAALQPEWISDTELVYADDPTGRWQLQRVILDALVRTSGPEVIAPADADTGYGLWVLGNRWYQPLADGRIVAIRTNGSDEIVLIENDGSENRLDVPATAHVSVDDVSGSRVLLSGGGASVSAGLWCVNVDSGDVEHVRGGQPVDEN